MEYKIDFKQIYNELPDMCVSTSEKTGMIIACNKATIDKLGFTEEEILSKMSIEMYHPSEVVKVKENLKSFISTGHVVHTELLVQKKDGNCIEVSLYFTPIKDENGVVLYSNAVWRDITEIKEMQRALQSEKEKVVEAHLQLAERHKEIADSINYAQRIQQAILPSDNNIKKYLNNSYFYFKSKDVVSGDFYWMEQVDNVTLFAAADCTGHGVPGAMVSVVCVNALNRSVREFGLTQPSKILDKTRELVIATFEQSDHDVNDGMDISLCAWNKTTNELQWAGANNPLWIVRNSAVIIEETKPDKQPIGKHEPLVPFTLHSIQLNKGDSVYVFTDGFQDQFGGLKGNKFKIKQLRETILNISDKPVLDQERILDHTFDIWKDDLEQVDDVCVIGVKI